MASLDFTNSSFVEFAKDVKINVTKINTQLNIKIRPRVSEDALAAEQNARRNMMNTFTSLHALDLFAEKIDRIDEHTRQMNSLSSSQAKAIARTLLPNLRDAIMTWMMAKMRIRKLVLQDQSNSIQLSLLRSSLWDAKLFPDSVTTMNKLNPVKNMTQLMGLGGMSTSSGQHYHRNTQRSNLHVDRSNYYNRSRAPTHNNQTFRDFNQGGATRNSHIPHHKENSVQTRTAGRGNQKSFDSQNQGPSNSGRGRGRGRGRSNPYDRPTSANKTHKNTK